MRRLLCSTVSLLALTASIALAADIPRRAPAPARAPAAVPLHNWTGFYIGINGGYGWADSDWSGFGANADPDGWLIGLTLGYNWQAPASPWVFGIEGDVAWSDIRGSFANALCAGCETRNEWLGTLRGRIGYAFDRLLPYVTGGLAVGDIHANPVGLPGASDTNAGWTVGAGIEAALAPNWSAKIEYLYVDLGSIGCSAVACGLPTDVDFRTNLVRAGLNFRF